MNCPSCHKEITADRLFCIWCEALVTDPKAETKAGLFRRWFATAIDPAIGILGWVLAVGLLGWVMGGAQSAGAAIVAGLFATSLYAVAYLWLLARGQTPGKWLLGERVVNKSNGEFPGLGRMLVREIVGKFVSGVFFGLGYFWAVFDKDSQAWHDKIAGTVVVRMPPKSGSA